MEQRLSGMIGSCKIETFQGSCLKLSDSIYDAAEAAYRTISY